MELLLILSALLSALTGVTAGTRAAEVRLHLAVAPTSRMTADAPSTAKRAVALHIQPSSSLGARSSGSIGELPVFRLRPASPIYLARRRE